MTPIARTRAVTTLSVLLSVLPAALAAQADPAGRRPDRRWDESEDSLPVNASRAWAFGVTTFTRGDFQPSGVEAAMAFRTAGLPVSAVAVGIRLGSFVQNQAVLIGRSQGFFASAVANLRRPLVTLAAVGTEDNPTYLKLELFLEGVASLNLNSPMPQGGAGGILAPLIGITFGGRYVLDQSLSLVVGPAWFVGKASEWHTQVSFRFQRPLGN